MKRKKVFIMLFVLFFGLTPLLVKAQMSHTNDTNSVQKKELTKQKDDEIITQEPQGENDAVAEGPAAELVKDGKGKATIVIDSDASDKEKETADDLQKYIKKMSDAKLPIVENGDDVKGTKIYIGDAVEDPDLDKIKKDGDDPASFRLHVTEDAVTLKGLSDEGTMNASSELLEQLGIRWFSPTDHGTVVPTSDTVSIKVQDTIQHPGFKTRLLRGGLRPDSMDEWEDRNRLGGTDYGSHGMPVDISKEKHPELYMQDEDGNPLGQLDVTKDEVLDRVVDAIKDDLAENPDKKDIRMGPNDGSGSSFGHSKWDADDWDPVAGRISVTDRYIKFYNKVFQRLEEEGHPDVTISSYMYAGAFRPPVRETPNSKFIPVFAPISIERLHGIENPLSWEQKYLKSVYEDWSELDDDLMFRGYYFNLADPAMPFPMLSKISDGIKFYKDNNFTRMRVEMMPNWGYQAPALYMASKMFWDPDLDPDAILDDYFTKFYGSAAEPMREHFEKLDKTFNEADYFAGGINDFQHILTPDVLQDLEESLSQAEEKADQSDNAIFAKRVHQTRIAFDYGKNFMQTIEGLNSFDFIKSNDRFGKVDDLADELISSNLVDERFPMSYKDRFWKKPVEQGYDRVTDGSQIVAELPDEWHAMLDPEGSGEQLKLWDPDLGTNSWMKLKTYSKTWSNQGLRYYFGHMWYRTTVDVSEAYKDRDIRLWLSNIDEEAQVWINGEKLSATNKGGALGQPWEFDATDAIKFDESNVIVVDINREGLNELGTGGMMGPVILWSPGDSVTAAGMKPLIDRFKQQGDIKDDLTARTLDHHLDSLSLFEKQGKIDKLLKHLTTFETLLEHNKNEGKVTEKVYNNLMNDRDTLESEHES